MAQNVPPTVVRLGLASLLLGAGWLILLLWVRGGDLADLLLAGLADPAAVARLAGKGLASPAAVYATVILFALELALLGILIAAGVGLLRLRPFARWAALFGCAGSIVVEGCSTLLHVFSLTPSGAAVKLVPIVVHGLVILAAIVLWGGLFLPEVVAACGGPANPTPATGAEGASSPQPALGSHNPEGLS